MTQRRLSGTTELALFLNRLVMSGVVSDDWAKRTLVEHYCRVQLAMIYRRLCSYIDIRSAEDEQTQHKQTRL